MEQPRIESPNPAAGANFGLGFAFAPASELLAIGALNDDAPGFPGSDHGTVTLLRRSHLGGGWSPVTTLHASDAQSSDNFGISVAFAGNEASLAVGAYRRNGPAGTNAGAIYIFSRSGDDWTQQATLTAANTTATAYLGWAVAVDETATVLAGAAPSTDLPGVPLAGAAHVFRRNGTAWVEEARLVAPDAEVDDQFGSDIAVSRDGLVIAVGAWNHGPGKVLRGAVYMFEYVSGAWTFIQKLTTDPAPYQADNLGGRVKLSQDGSTLVAGAISDDGPGSCVVFERLGSTWSQTARIRPSSPTIPSDALGGSLFVSADGNTVAVGDYDAMNASGVRTGAAYVFRKEGGNWIERLRVTPSGDVPREAFGAYAIAMTSDNSTLFVPSWLESVGVSGEAGAVYEYALTTAPSIITAPSAVETCSNNTITLTVQAGGSAPLSYVWRRNGVPIDPEVNPTAGESSLVLNGVPRSAAGQYDCIVMNTCGSATTPPAMLTVCNFVADLNCDARVDLGDLAVILSNFGRTDGPTRTDGDIDANGMVNLTDLAHLLLEFGETCN